MNFFETYIISSTGKAAGLCQKSVAVLSLLRSNCKYIVWLSLLFKEAASIAKFWWSTVALATGPNYCRYFDTFL